jgi:hypothetical protein
LNPVGEVADWRITGASGWRQISERLPKVAPIYRPSFKKRARLIQQKRAMRIGVMADSTLSLVDMRIAYKVATIARATKKPEMSFR